mgnify:CR=1 FL=1
MKYLSIIAGLSLLLLISCSSDTSPGTVVREKPSINYAHGKINQVLIISDSSVWKGLPGDTFFYYFTAPYILLPQPEPIFDINHLTMEELAKQSVKKEFRTIIFLADLNNLNSPTTRQVLADIGPEKMAEAKKDQGYTVIVGHDKWARSQLLFYVAGFGEKKLVENIVKNFPAIARRINEKDNEIVKATAYQAGENADLEAEVKTLYNLNLKVPGDFKKVKYYTNTQTLWMRRDAREVVANILIHKIPYTNKSQLTKEGIKEIRNSIGKHITTRQPNSFMRINDVDLPLFVENTTLNNVYTVQAKGIWDIENDFMGGPFVSNLMLNPKTNELVLVDGFIYAPSKDKRNYMQELEFIIASAQF